VKHRFSLLWIAASVWASAPAANAADDWQYWNEFVLEHKVTDKLALGLAFRQKWQDNFSDFFLYSVTIVPTVNLSKGVTLGAGYRWERREEDDHWITENRLLFPLALEWTFEPWTIQWRNQPEYRELEDRDRWRIRERILVERPVRLGPSTVTLFASEEVFYDFTEGETNQNRLAMGLSLPLRERMSLDLFYMYKAEKDGHWSFANVLGTELTIEF